MSEKQTGSPFVDSKVTTVYHESVGVHILMCGVLSFFVILSMKITRALISMLMYSRLHLTSEYVMANYHYTGREIRALSEGHSTRTKEGWIHSLASSPNMVIRHLGTGGVILMFVVIMG